ncbi:MAG: alpha-ketoglutarate-dependent dioxygenase AlkB [Hyphomicrobiaceae bacterium]
MNAFPPGFQHLPGYFDLAAQRELLGRLRDAMATAPLFVPTMPRTGKPFGVRMTNCGPLGWVSDQEGGYRYEATHPVTGLAWPPTPPVLLALWAELADYPAPPEACLINYYADGTKMGSHVDADERDFAAPVLSVSLGDDATFHVGGLHRSDPKQRLRLQSGDVVVLGGAARRAYHGIDRVFANTSPLLPEGGRINLTLRRVTMPAI